MSCKWLYADWCHHDDGTGEFQEKCHWDCYGDVKNCCNYEEKENGR